MSDLKLNLQEMETKTHYASMFTAAMYVIEAIMEGEAVDEDVYLNGLAYFYGSLLTLQARLILSARDPEMLEHVETMVRQRDDFIMNDLEARANPDGIEGRGPWRNG